MIEQRRKQGWTFVFLGANQDSFGSASALGMSRHSTSNYVADARARSATSTSRASTAQSRTFSAAAAAASRMLLRRAAATATVSTAMATAGGAGTAGVEGQGPMLIDVSSVLTTSPSTRRR